MESKRLRILVLGGTRFVGRALVEAALAAGHELTLFNRALTNPDLFPEVERRQLILRREYPLTPTNRLNRLLAISRLMF